MSVQWYLPLAGGKLILNNIQDIKEIFEKMKTNIFIWIIYLDFFFMHIWMNADKEL